MACLQTLKTELRTLEATFPRTHERLQIVSASVDELTCKFVDSHNRKHLIHANITETYPQSPPVWFSESEDAAVTSALAALSEGACKGAAAGASAASGADSTQAAGGGGEGLANLENHILYQVRLKKFCIFPFVNRSSFNE